MNDASEESVAETRIRDRQTGSARDVFNPPLFDVTMGDSELLADSYTQQLLFGMNGPEYNFLWGDAQLQSPFLSSNLFNTVSLPVTNTPLTDYTTSSNAHGNDVASSSSLAWGPQEPSPFEHQPPEPPLTESQSAFATRLPSMEPEKPELIPAMAALDDENPSNPQVQLVRRTETVRPWKISPADYSQILRDSATLRDGLPGPFSLPSKHMLSRFLEGYFRGFHVHLPLLHCVTFSAARVGLELLLSMAAVGALYRYEHAQGYRLYGAARSLITWRLARRDTLVLQRLMNGEATYVGHTRFQNRSADIDNTALGDEVAGDSGDRDKVDLRTLQAMVVLTAMASWGHRDLTRDALAMSSQVAMLARDLGISKPEEHSPPGTPWKEWVQQEERRRTLFVAYSLLNLQSVAFDTAPLILNREVAIRLPGCASTWDSLNPTDWSTLRDKCLPPQPFRKKLQQLLSGEQIHLEAAISSFANHVLIHGLVQHIFLARNSSANRDALGGEFISKMESSLRAWQESWEATYESTTDPSSPKGPMGFNATAMLRLAYIRLNADLGPACRLLDLDSRDVAAAFFAAKHTIGVKDRSPQLDRAVLQCAHALSIPVRVGVAFVARTQPLTWSIQHALCNLECAFFLARWLLLVSEFVKGSGFDSLREDERRLVNMVASLVQETEFADSLDGVRSHALLISGLAVSTTRLWAQTFKGSHVFDIVRLVGDGLAILAETLESEASVEDPSRVALPQP
ncbi:uncharacterized protein ColSpa_02319 [Colletotrichum spaethianum]|uniref:Xylanolytic transcriptional activator regulatory domain-containing protein n=1 Tax=Colletotrichum spaethianum TaxID=700344 RepID=A0AA37L9G0_9PEZI|nr:uncharacterized protein ColSpa_02319 [Colletotrichum spaethianum]GKT42138.1 hypothetical protein ColSpa_02319 [Colletotrichum spaethianum]